MPTSTARRSTAPGHSGTWIPSPLAVTTPSRVDTVAGSRFIGGEPMKRATNVVAGVSNTSVGEPTCSSAPLCMTATRVAIVIASTWSWVT